MKKDFRALNIGRHSRMIMIPNLSMPRLHMTASESLLPTISNMTLGKKLKQISLAGLQLKKNAATVS